MHPLNLVSADWQKALPVLIVAGIVVWFVLFRTTPTTEQALFAALLIIYMVHQIEEHLWPGGFRQFANAHVFKSHNDDWPVSEGGVALVNVGYVWLPILLAALFPGPLRWVGLGWVGLTLINGIIAHRDLDPLPGLQSRADHLDRPVSAVHDLDARA